MKQLKTIFLNLIFWTVVCGIVFPAIIYILGQSLFPQQSNGSLIFNEKGQVIGSNLIGQNFDSPIYFWGRPSATSPKPYDATNSSGSNLGPKNPELKKQIEARYQLLQQGNFGHQEVPVGLIYSSASGLDPHIRPEDAIYQVERIAKARGVPEETLKTIIEKNIETSFLFIFGENRLNVLSLNLELDQKFGKK